MNEFGQYIRKAREVRAGRDRSYSLRRVSQRVGVQPAYLSQIERGGLAPPSEEVILRLAADLGEDSDVLLALGGKIASDLKEIILKRPRLMADLLRQLREMPEDAIVRLVREVRDGDW